MPSEIKNETCFFRPDPGRSCRREGCVIFEDCPDGRTTLQEGENTITVPQRDSTVRIFPEGHTGKGS